MAMMQINWRPDAKALREFAEIWMFFFGMVLAPLAYFGRGPFHYFEYDRLTMAATMWLIAVVVRLLAMVRPAWVRPVFLGMTLLALPIGWVISHVAMAVIYFGVFTPVALVFRLLGRDALRRRLDRSAASYWEDYNPDQGKARYLRQF